MPTTRAPGPAPPVTTIPLAVLNAVGFKYVRSEASQLFTTNFSRLLDTTQDLGCGILSEYIGALQAQVVDKKVIKCADFYRSADLQALAMRSELVSVLSVMPHVTPQVRASVDTLSSSLRAFLRQTVQPLCTKGQFDARQLQDRLRLISTAYCKAAPVVAATALPGDVLNREVLIHTLAASCPAKMLSSTGLAPLDDGTGAQRWVIRQAGRLGEYYFTCKQRLLSAPPGGCGQNNLVFTDKDDGSGLQRWKVEISKTVRGAFHIVNMGRGQCSKFISTAVDQAPGRVVTCSLALSLTATTANEAFAIKPVPQAVLPLVAQGTVLVAPGPATSAVVNYVHAGKSLTARYACGASCARLAKGQTVWVSFYLARPEVAVDFSLSRPVWVLAEGRVVGVASGKDARTGTFRTTVVVRSGTKAVTQVLLYPRVLPAGTVLPMVVDAATMRVLNVPVPDPTQPTLAPIVIIPGPTDPGYTAGPVDPNYGLPPGTVPIDQGLVDAIYGTGGVQDGAADIAGIPGLLAGVVDANGNEVNLGRLFDENGVPVPPSAFVGPDGQPIPGMQLFDASGNPVNVQKLFDADGNRLTSVVQDNDITTTVNDNDITTTINSEDNDTTIINSEDNDTTINNEDNDTTINEDNDITINEDNDITTTINEDNDTTGGSTVYDNDVYNYYNSLAPTADATGGGEDDTTAPPPSGETKSRKWLMWLGIAVAVIALVIGGWWAWKRYGPAGKSSQAAAGGSNTWSGGNTGGGYDQPSSSMQRQMDANGGLTDSEVSDMAEVAMNTPRR